MAMPNIQYMLIKKLYSHTCANYTKKENNFIYAAGKRCSVNKSLFIHYTSKDLNESSLDKGKFDVTGTAWINLQCTLLFTEI